ncbi:uncharacterized protein STEHIDRAFT_124778 [Stereum hirsutum FP-91666 SS1]|uniref:uncharacterized protein n=1 Tax=Stereum hirsutum (strain FP-91666) TaxID=721885 RepID=UPI00044494BF|nr:uncharacterized protein STEHIDRAFT_124778 [Stereum hirsutum FP-91666 SS1]EIM81912.1 hypothetical protein STEHIDRAFT_124778 [Stereum hirsutum FP-91666 SS1]
MFEVDSRLRVPAGQLKVGPTSTSLNPLPLDLIFHPQTHSNPSIDDLLSFRTAPTPTPTSLHRQANTLTHLPTAPRPPITSGNTLITLLSKPPRHRRSIASFPPPSCSALRGRKYCAAVRVSEARLDLSLRASPVSVLSLFLFWREGGLIPSTIDS